MAPIDLDAIEDEWDDDPTDVPRSRKLSPAARQRIERLATARVVAVDRGRITIVLDDDDKADDAVPIEAALAGTMRHDKAVVGDQVRVKVARHATDTARVVEVLPRWSQLLRTGDDDIDDARVVVANADQVVVVIAANYLEAGRRLLDRIMIAASVGGLRTALCVNKIDLDHDRDAVAEVVARYAGLGVAAVTTSATTGEGLTALRELVEGRWSAFTGHSGVGKSSLFNQLVPDAAHAVGDLGARGGRHTTVASRAMRLPEATGWIVDTPGIRSFGLGIVDPRDLAQHVPEFADLECGLDDCLHDGEPDCALDGAAVDPERLMSYRRLLAALRGGAS